MAPSKDINDPDVFILYRYHPSEVAAIIFVVLFGISTLVHAGQAWRKRSWFMIPFIIGGLFEMVGYIGRVLSSHDQWELGPYIMQSLLLLVAPALFAASIYMVLGRIILLTNGEKYALVRRTWLTKFFVGGDVLSFLAQSAGGGIMSMAKKNPDNMKLGEKIVIVGLFIQIAFFGFFVIVSILFQIRGRDHFRQLDSTVRWRKYLYMLYTVSILILVRSVFRVVEYLQGNAGYLLRHEVFLYVFDAMLMFKAMLIMNVIHPGEITQHLKKQQKDAVSMEQLQDSDYSREGVDRV